jgi:Sulfotransferase domain.
MESRIYLPDVLYIGYQKTGTTFLRSYFKERNDILLTRGGQALQKNTTLSLEEKNKQYLETMNRNILSKPDNYNFHIDMYEGLLGYFFKNGIDKWTPEIMLNSMPLFNGDVEFNPNVFFKSLKNFFPKKIKLLVTIRNQIDFLDSNYRHMRGYFDAQYNFLKFISSKEGKIIAAAAQYDRIVTSLFSEFGKDNVFILPLEFLIQNQTDTLRSICNFLNIDMVNVDKTLNKNIGAKYNDEKQKIGIRKNSWNDGKTCDIYPPNNEEKILLKALYAGSNSILFDLIGKDLSCYGYYT